MTPIEERLLVLRQSGFPLGRAGPLIDEAILEIQRLQYRDRLLTALEAGGVDNWEWYGESTKEFHRSLDEGDDE